MKISPKAKHRRAIVQLIEDIIGSALFLGLLWLFCWCVGLLMKAAGVA